MIELLDLEKAHAFLMKAVRSRDTETTKGEDHKHFGPDHPDWENLGPLDEYRNRTCYNVFSHVSGEDGKRLLQPGCLIGTAFHEAGVSLEWMDEKGMESSDTSEFMNRLGEDGMASGHTPQGGRFLADCQTHQDDGKTWGEAISLTLKELKEDQDYYARNHPTYTWGTDAEVEWIREQQV